MSRPRRERLSVRGVEAVGPYTLVRVERGGLAPGAPGQFFMLEAPGCLLPRPLSLCLAPRGELAFLIDPDRARDVALAELDAGERHPRLRAARQRLPARRRRGRCSSAGASASRRCRTSPRRSSGRPPCSASGRSTTPRRPCSFRTPRS